jgi:hypothetical protein
VCADTTSVLLPTSKLEDELRQPTTTQSGEAVDGGGSERTTLWHVRSSSIRRPANVSIPGRSLVAALGLSRSKATARLLYYWPPGSRLGKGSFTSEPIAWCRSKGAVPFLT